MCLCNFNYNKNVLYALFLYYLYSVPQGELFSFAMYFISPNLLSYSNSIKYIIFWLYTIWFGGRILKNQKRIDRQIFVI